MTRFSKYKHIDRYKKIILVFIKHGFGRIIDELGILSYLKISKRTMKNTTKDNYTKLTIGERIRLSLEELGPTFIKLGQIISTRPDILSQDIIKELQKLQSSVPPFPFEEVEKLIESELENTIDNIYVKFEEKPLAAASIAQVHLAELPSGEKVVVKVQRPNIEKTIGLDLKILKDLAYFIDNHTKYGKLHDFTKTVKEFESSIKNELNFLNEGKNIEIFKENFKGDKTVKIPYVNLDLTTRRILTMEYINGLPLTEFESLDKLGFDRKVIANRLSTAIFNQILRDGFFHGDPHPGNIMILEEDVVAFLDFGMVGNISEDKKAQIFKILIGIIYKNSKLITQGIIELDPTLSNIDLKKFEIDIDILRDKYLSMPISDINIGDLFEEVFNVAFAYNIKIPEEFSMLAKSIITLEGLVAKLDPELSILEIAEPTVIRLMFRVYSIEYIGKHFINELINYGILMKKMPDYIFKFIRKLESEDFKVKLEIQEIEYIEKQKIKALNRIYLSILLLSLSIIIFGVIFSIGFNS